MHIPDGYLSPQTYGSFLAIMVPVWTMASRILKRRFQTRQVPMFAMSAAFCFVVMMFNIPIPGGTSGHATGAALVGILLGPWAAVMAVSIALIIQALLFGDGGITAIGANCFNTAVVVPTVGYWTYRFLAEGSKVESTRRMISAGVAGYISLNVSALIVAIQLGVQPLIAKNALGQPLYSPFPLQVTVPVMASTHLLFFGFAEALITAGVFRYFQKSDPAMLQSVSLPRPHIA